jgi:hypothetical protein
MSTCLTGARRRFRLTVETGFSEFQWRLSPNFSGPGVGRCEIEGIDHIVFRQGLGTSIVEDEGGRGIGDL